ncbi:MAG: PPOX class F420-dependent oxidoreductase [Chloroflexi bacterium]|nr:PPOX class F420-dependent oxidoreductase [Chloroflexota bacterium]
MPAISEQPASVAAFLNQPGLLATATTLNRDGSPQLSYIFFSLDGDDILFSTTSDRVKAKNLVRDPRINFAAVDPANAYRWVIIGGTATVTTEGAFEYIERSAARRMSPEKAKEYADNMRHQARVVVRITPQKVRAMGLE